MIIFDLFEDANKKSQGVTEGEFTISDDPAAHIKLLFLKTINGNEYRLVKQGDVYNIYINRSRKSKQEFSSFDLAKRALQQLLLNAVHSDQQGVAEGEHDDQFINDEDAWYNMADFARKKMSQGQAMADVIKYLVDNNYLLQHEVGNFTKTLRGEKWNESVAEAHSPEEFVQGLKKTAKKKHKFQVGDWVTIDPNETAGWAASGMMGRIVDLTGDGRATINVNPGGGATGVQRRLNNIDADFNIKSSGTHTVVPVKMLELLPVSLDEQGLAEAEERIDPILIKALNRMPDGLATHGQVLDAAYDAYAMELGKMRMKSEYGVTNVYIPKLMDLYKNKHGLTFNEAQGAEELDEIDRRGFLRGVGAAAGLAAMGGAKAATSPDDASWSKIGQPFDDSITANSTVTQTDGQKPKLTDRIASVKGPNSKGEYLVTVMQDHDIVSHYVTKTPPASWMKGKHQAYAQLESNRQGMTESLRPGEYHVWTVHFDDGTTRGFRVPSDEYPDGLGRISRY